MMSTQGHLTSCNHNFSAKANQEGEVIVFVEYKRLPLFTPPPPNHTHMH